MKLSRKLVMVSAAALMAVSPLAAPVVNSSVAQAATKKSSTSSKIYNTYGKKSKVKVTKAQYFVNQNGKKTSKKAPKNGSYTIWNVKEINGEVYYSIQTDLKYWIPAVDTKGSVQYKKGSTTVTLTTDGKKVVQTEKTVKTVKKSTSKKSTTKASTKSSKKTTSKKSTSTKKATSTKKSTSTEKSASTKKSTSTKKTTSTKKSTSTQKSTSKKTTSKKSTKKAVKVVKIKATKKTPVVDTKGKQVKTYMGSKKYNVIGKGVTVNGIGTKKINGKTYYALQPNHYYVLAANFKVVK